MSNPVNLLLLLSALLSALTGVGGAVRRPQPAEAVAIVGTAAATAVREARVPARPAASLPSLLIVAAAPVAALPVVQHRPRVSDRPHE